MTTSKRNIQLANDLLDWNRKNLRADVTLTESVIAEKFASHFIVKANGRRYEANHSNYLQFLNGFKSTIKTIDYTVEHITANENSVVLAMSATVARIDGKTDTFEAMLLLIFNEQGHVTLWHEVYLPIPQH
ncbi:MAG TPA: hypothetical protein VF412_18970 [Bdellovibrio sp.]|uniref:hypothetical protein n=1 Tax=Bdellovibrio sp. TaxID=28201 RepID=UPI002EE786F9